MTDDEETTIKSTKFNEFTLITLKVINGRRKKIIL